MHFAEIDSNGIVLRVIVAEQDFIDSEALGPKENWIQTSYNTHQGIHSGGKTPLRKNYAGKGFKYHSDIDAFVHPKDPKNISWGLNEDKGIYEAPIPMPNDGKQYDWDEKNQTWKNIMVTIPRVDV